MSDVDLGACCVCNTTQGVVNIVTLSRRLPEWLQGQNLGWGCFKCNLPQDGIVAVYCGKCIEEGDEAIYGRLGGKRANERIKLNNFPFIPFEHDLKHHPEEFPANGAERVMMFPDSPEPGPDCLCSWCGKAVLTLPKRLFDMESGCEARFHEGCFKYLDKSEWRN